MTNYLPDATDFTEMELKSDPRQTYSHMEGYTICPKCHGYGGWNLRLNAYGQPGDPPNRRHFRAMCFQCHGWGWVSTEDARCLHTYVEIAPDQPWRCWHTYRCTMCGRTKSVDSSD